MKRTYPILLLFVLSITCFTVMSCESSQDPDLLQHRQFVLNCTYDTFNHATRAGESTYGVKDGDIMYLDFAGFKTSAVYSTGTKKWTLSSYPTTASGSVKAYLPSSLTAQSVALMGEGTFTNTTEALVVTVTLKPITARMRFKGNAGQTATIDGLRYYNSFDTSTYTYADVTSSLTLTTGSDGYTPYVYVLFADKSKLTITYNGETYLQSFSSNVLQPGKSGWVDMNITYKPVDLGLSVKWATCNVGAGSSDEAGDYFAWGEIASKQTYSWSTYKYCNGKETTLTKYNDDGNFGKVDKLTILTSADDAASAICGSNWRMPTLDEFYELTSKCTRQWTTQDGTKGMRITGPNGNSIFLPAAGYKTASQTDSYGTDGWYWTSETADACHLFSTSTSLNFNLNWTRCYGCNVRPVCE